MITTFLVIASASISLFFLASFMVFKKLASEKNEALEVTQPVISNEQVNEIKKHVTKEVIIELYELVNANNGHYSYDDNNRLDELDSEIENLDNVFSITGTH